MNIRPIPGHDGYAASDCGRIISLGRTTKRGNVAYRVQQRELRQKIGASGYAIVKLLPIRKNSMQLVHRLVMFAFAAPDSERLHVNHINGNRLDNRLANLEWTNHSENALHAFRVLKVKHVVQPKGGNSPLAKRVVGINQTTGEKVYFESLADARQIGCTPSGICSAISGHQHTHRGMQWEYFQE